ncbi:MAG: hypothetical protein ABR958_00205 [Dehalococcoidales bacterium]
MATIVEINNLKRGYQRMGKYDKYFYSKAQGITGPSRPEIKGTSILVDKGKLGDFGIGWVPIFKPFKMVPEGHKHDYAQILAFIGGNLSDVFDFDAEIELYVGGEKHIINQTTVVYVPGGVMHCPLYFNRVGKPLLFNNMYFTAEYMKKTD